MLLKAIEEVGPRNAAQATTELVGGEVKIRYLHNS